VPVYAFGPGFRPASGHDRQRIALFDASSVASRIARVVAPHGGRGDYVSLGPEPHIPSGRFYEGHQQSCVIAIAARLS
jgi:hypothetical protein